MAVFDLLTTTDIIIFVVTAITRGYYARTHMPRSEPPFSPPTAWGVLLLQTLAARHEDIARRPTQETRHSPIPVQDYYEQVVDITSNIT